jgi:hypothetical protein
LEVKKSFYGIKKEVNDFLQHMDEIEFILRPQCDKISKVGVKIRQKIRLIRRNLWHNFLFFFSFFSHRKRESFIRRVCMQYNFLSIFYHPFFFFIFLLKAITILQLVWLIFRQPQKEFPRVRFCLPFWGFIISSLEKLF